MSSWFHTIFPFIKVIQNSPDSNYYVFPSIGIGIIILVAVGFSLSFYFFKYRPCKADLIDIINILKEWKIKSPENFEVLNQSLSENEILGHLWSEFDETLVKTKTEEGEEKVFNTIDANHFFNDNTLIEPRINLRFYNALPGYLTGLGILGTFLGLTFGLAQIDLSTDDLDKLKNGITGLLSGAQIAFSTSVWGIFFSILFSWFEKHHVNELRNHISKLQISIDKIVTRRTPEHWLSEVLWESKQQSQELKSFNTDLAVSIAEALDEKLAGSLTPTLEKLLFSIDELSKAGTTKIAETITKGAGNEISRLANTMDQVDKILKQTITQSFETQKVMEESMQKQLNSFSGNVSEIVKNFGDQVENVSSRYSDERSQIDTLLEKLDGNLKNMENILEGAGLAAEAFKESALPVKRVTSELINIVEKIQTSQKTFSETIVNSQNYTEKMSKTMEDALAHMRNALDTTTENWQAYENKFGEIKESLGDVFNELNKGLRDYKEETGQSIVNYLSKLDHSLKEAVKHLSGAIEQLRETIEEHKE